jgi:hypothetical protein
MSSMSLAITVGSRARLAYPGHPLPYVDPRAIGINSPPPKDPTPDGNDITERSDSVRDRITLSTRIRQTPQTDRATRRKESLAQPVTRTMTGRTLLEMADSVADRVTLSRRKEKAPAQQTSYSKYGEPAWGMMEEPSPELDALATDVTDQVTLAGDAIPAAEGPEITVYLGGNEFPRLPAGV